MAWTYAAAGNGSDMHKIGTLIGEHNRRLQILTNGTYGLVGKTLVDLNTHFDAEGGDLEGEIKSSLIDRINTERNGLLGAQRDWRNFVDDWFLKQGYNEFNSASRSVDEVIRDLQADMDTNSKTVKAGVGSIAGAGGNKHIFTCKIHSELTWITGSVVDVEFFTEKDGSTETLTFEATNSQNISGVTTFDVYGEPRPEKDFYENDNGFGRLATYSTLGWAEGGILVNSNAVTAAGTDEVASGWRGFTADPAGSATTPNTTLITRESDDDIAYHDDGNVGTYFEMEGDDVITSLWLAQVLQNPLQDIEETPWGSAINNGTKSSIASANEGKVYFYTFYYRNVPAGYTLAPFLIRNGSEASASEIVKSITADDSNTWRLGVFAFVIPQGATAKQMIGGMKLTHGVAIASGINVRIDQQKFRLGSVIGNFWFCGVPSMDPIAKDQTETFTLTQTSQSVWQKYFVETYTDRFNQRVQLPSTSTGETEADTLIAFDG